MNTIEKQILAEKISEIILKNLTKGLTPQQAKYQLLELVIAEKEKTREEIIFVIQENILKLNPYKHQPFWKHESKTQEEKISRDSYYNGAITTKVMIKKILNSLKSTPTTTEEEKK